MKDQEIALKGKGRFDNPYAQVPEDPKEIVFQKDGFGIRLDIAHSRRTVFGP